MTGLRTLLIERLLGQTRLAVIEDGRLMELYVERPGMENVVGNLYLGRVERVVAGMNAAFVDLGLQKSGFLAMDNAPSNDPALKAALGDRRIEKLLRPGQSVLVQVTKAQSGVKGPRVSMDITLPGRMMALLGETRYVGVSRKITDADERARLHGIGSALLAEGGAGLILRTASMGASEASIREEYARLSDWWRAIRTRAEHGVAPVCLHDDNALALRAVRDKLGPRVDALWVDGEALFEEISELASRIAPEWTDRISLHTGQTPLFDLYRVDAQADKALQKYVWLDSGGSIVIEETEALTVCDVNTGKYLGRKDAEDTRFRANLEAARELMRQIRLRDIGGIVVADFIDMKSEAQQKALLDALRAYARDDDTRVNVAGITSLGLVEMTRKKARQSLSRQLLHTCSDCGGNGAVPSHETTARRIVRELWRRRRAGDASALLVEAGAKVCGWLKTIGAPSGGATYARAKTDLAAGEYSVAPVDEAALPRDAIQLK